MSLKIIYVLSFYFFIFLYFINLIILINLYKNIFILFIKNIFILFFLLFIISFFLYYYKYYIIFIFFNSFKEIINFFIFIKKLIKKEFFIFNPPIFYNIFIIDKIENIFLKRGSYLIFVKLYNIISNKNDYIFLNIFLIFIIIIFEIHLIYFVFFICIFKNFYKENFFYFFIYDLEKFLIPNIEKIKNYRIIVDNLEVWTNGYFFLFNFLKNNPEFIHIIQDIDFLNYSRLRESLYSEKLVKTLTPNGFFSTHNCLESILAFNLIRTHDKNIDSIQFELNNKKESWVFSKNSEIIFLKNIYPKKNYFDLYEIALNFLNKKEENNQKIKFINNFINKPSEYEESSIKDYLGNNSLININNLNLFNYNEFITFFLIKYKDIKKDKLIIFINHMKNNEFNYNDIIKFKDINNLN